MANIQSVITITHGSTESYRTILDRVLKAASKPKEEAISLRNMFHAFAGTDKIAKFNVEVNTGDAVSATGTITLASMVAADTVTIGGVVLTAVASAPTSIQFVVGTDTVTAANMAATINALPALNQMVRATSAAGVVTLTCLVPGTIGNLVTLAISAHGTVSGSGKLTSGAQSTTYSTVNTYRLGV